MSITEHTLRETVPCFLNTKAWSQAIRVLMRAGYWQQKFLYGMAPQLLEELQRAVQVIPSSEENYTVLVGLQRALERELSFLMKHPTAIFQSLWNLCLWYDNPDQLAHFDLPEDQWHGDTETWQTVAEHHLHPVGKPLPPVRRESWMTDEMMMSKSRGWEWNSSGRVAWHEAICPVCGTGEKYGSGNYSTELKVMFLDGEPQSFDRLIERLTITCDCKVGTDDRAGLCLIPYTHIGWTQEKVLTYLDSIGSPLASLSSLNDIPTAAGLEKLQHYLGITQPVQESVVAEIIDHPIRAANINQRETQSSPTRSSLLPLLESWRTRQSTSTDNTIWIRSLRPPVLALGSAQRLTVQIHREEVTGIAYLPNERNIVSTSTDQTIRITNTETGLEVFCVETKAALYTLALNTTGVHLLTGSDKGVQLWGIIDNERIELIREFSTESRITCVCFSDDGQSIGAGTIDGDLYWWSADGSKKLWQGHSQAVRIVRCLADDTLVSSAEDSTIRYWNLATATEIECLQFINTGQVEHFSISSDGRFIVVSESKRWSIWDVQERKLLTTFLRSFGRFDPCCFSSDSRQLITAAGDRTIRVWETATGRELACHRYNPASPRVLAFASNNQSFVSGSREGIITVYQTLSGDEIPCLRGHRSGETFGAAAFTPDGYWLVTGGDWSVRVWNPHTGIEQAYSQFGNPKDDNPKVLQIAVSPNSDLFATLSLDNKLRIWTVADCSLLEVEECDFRRSIVFTNTGVQVLDEEDAAPEIDLQSRRWKLVSTETETVIQSAATGEPIAWFPETMESIAYHTNQKTFAGIGNGSLYLFELEGLDLGEQSSA